MHLHTFAPRQCCKLPYGGLRVYPNIAPRKTVSPWSYVCYNGLGACVLTTEPEKRAIRWRSLISYVVVHAFLSWMCITYPGEGGWYESAITDQVNKRQIKGITICVLPRFGKESWPVDMKSALSVFGLPMLASVFWNSLGALCLYCSDVSLKAPKSLKCVRLLINFIYLFCFWKICICFQMFCTFSSFEGLVLNIERINVEYPIDFMKWKHWV